MFVYGVVEVIEALVAATPLYGTAILAGIAKVVGAPVVLALGAKLLVLFYAEEE
jgi:hypothetical protein